VSVHGLGSGDVFGEENLVLGRAPCCYAVATSPSVIHALPRETMQQLMTSPDFCRQLGTSMIEKLEIRSAKSVVRYFDGTPHVQGLIPASVVTERKVIDLGETNEQVTVGFVNADVESAYAAAGRYIVGKRIRLELVKESDFKRFAAAAPAKAPPPPPGKPDPRAGETGTALLEGLIANGFTERASDIHFEPGENALTVRYRIDGVLKEIGEKIPAAVAKEVVSRLKVMSGMDISNHFTPQDGQLKISVGGDTVIARASVIPTKLGEKMVLRLIRSKSSIIPYNMISPDRRLINILREVVNARQGLFLITGPTGSGKSTTLYSLLNELNRVDSNCVTLEDPVEMNIPGISQMEMNEKTGLTFARALRSVLRQDPDVIMVGEVRDEESAEIVFKAAITGHLVLSTLHTNNSLDVTARLRELGVSPATIATALIGVLAQRLVRSVCRDCREMRPIKPYEAQLIRETYPDVVLPETMAEGRGCARCHDTGYFDRLPVFEVWRKTTAIKGLLARDPANYEGLEKTARADGFVSLQEFGLKLALAGLTTVDEVLRCISES
jgi:type II secretory ATPase GspE/PulE/Tfp pilus assembly ATPase PilB-like protein